MKLVYHIIKINKRCFATPYNKIAKIIRNNIIIKTISRNIIRNVNPKVLNKKYRMANKINKIVIILLNSKK